ncbi:MAG: four helix bundle protein [bacterium]
MKFKRFEDMPVWQDARKLTSIIYRLTAKGKLSSDYGLKDQMQRSAVSVMSNIAEGYERHTKKEFIAFLYHAKGSVGELRSQLYVALDLQYISQSEFEEAFTLSVSIINQTAGFITFLSRSI